MNVRHREFSTAETATAEQKVLVFPTEDEAVAFAAAARQNYADCPRRESRRPGITATGNDHGAVNVEDAWKKVLRTAVNKLYPRRPGGPDPTCFNKCTCIY
ncbi:hypothetical protein ACFCXA_00910 [Streptomyces virginiae]|uniref:hypothetical protein n=1 Tax=Streptomyces virginiae TaxID=1961 RepID=UPI0035DF64C2